MRIERVKPQLLRVELHPFELASLVSAARWVIEDHQGRPPAEALHQLEQVVANYDRQTSEVS